MQFKGNLYGDVYLSLDAIYWPPYIPMAKARGLTVAEIRQHSYRAKVRDILFLLNFHIYQQRLIDLPAHDQPNTIFLTRRKSHHVSDDNEREKRLC